MQIGIRELKAKLSEYVRLVREGEHIEVTDHGLPVARLTPLPYYPFPDSTGGSPLREPTPRYDTAPVLKEKHRKGRSTKEPKQSYASLLKEAQKAGGHRSPKETLTHALQEYRDYQKRLEFIALLGTVDFHPGYNPKDGRRKR